MMLIRCALFLGILSVGLIARAETPPLVRAQLDTVGFAVDRRDFAQVLYAANTAEGLNDPLARRSAWPAVAAIMPHDDYLYAGRTAVHTLPYLRADRWVVFGVCHACRRLGVRDRLLLDDYDDWCVAGQDFPVDEELRAELLKRLGDGAEVSRERHAKEHSVEALLPWIGAGAGDFTFVPILVPGMEPEHLDSLAIALGVILANICRERGWIPGKDLGLMISADAVHYGCDGWGDHPYDEFGCDEAGHAAARAQDIELIRQTIAGIAGPWPVENFIRQVWDRDRPDYPAYPYKIPWCGLYSIPFGLTAGGMMALEVDQPGLLTGTLLRYGDSATDGRLECDTKSLGVTAPANLRHWVGYPTLVYRIEGMGDIFPGGE